MKVRYDAEGDALYVPLQKVATAVDHSILVDDTRTVDLDVEKEPVGIEILGASAGVKLLDLVERFGLEKFEGDFMAIEQHRFKAT